MRLTHAFATTASCSASRQCDSYRTAQSHERTLRARSRLPSFFRVRKSEVAAGCVWPRRAIARRSAASCTSSRRRFFKFDREIKAGPRSTVAMADACRDFLAERSDKPFFLYFCPTDPHRDGGTIADDQLKPNSFGNRPQDIRA